MPSAPSAKLVRAAHAQYAAVAQRAAREAPAESGTPAWVLALCGLLAVVVAIAWGFVPISSKYLMEAGFGPWALLVLRAVIAYGVMVLIAPMRLYAGLRTEVLAMLLGAALVPAGWGLQNVALVDGTVSDVAISAAVAPIFAGMIASALLRTALHWLLTLGAVTVIAGLLLTFFDTGVMQGSSLIPIGWGLLAAIGLALYSLLLRACGDVSAALLMRKILGWGLIASLPFYFAESAASPTDGELLARPDVIANLIFLAAAAAGTFFWHSITLRIGTRAAGPISHLAPAAAVAASIALFDDPISYVGIMGGAMVLCGAVCAHTGLLKLAAIAARRF